MWSSLARSAKATSNDFLGKACALLFPIDWPEPFGLVMIEAMACGTPVIAFRRGSVAEVLEQGVSGFIVEPADEQGALDALGRLHSLDRREVRAAFERRFTARRMAENYLRIYASLRSSFSASPLWPGNSHPASNPLPSQPASSPCAFLEMRQLSGEPSLSGNNK